MSTSNELSRPVPSRNRRSARARTSLRLLGLAGLWALLAACSSVDRSHDDTEEPPILNDEQRAELAAYVSSALDRYDVPGAALAVVKDGEVIYQAGFGVRDREGVQPVTTKTLFQLASVTKPMTTLMMASLSDDGLLAWNTKVQQVIPTFALSSPESSAQVRVRDLMDMSSGLPEFHTPMFLENLRPTALISSLKDIPVTAALGEHWAYSNQGFATGGFVAARLAGSAYGDASLRAMYAAQMTARVFEPIGMQRTTLDFDEALADADHASPHRYDPLTDSNRPMPVAFDRFMEQTLPAGGAWSDIEDMARFAITEFEGAAPDGTRVVSTKSIETMHTPHLSMPEGGKYGLGWEIWDDYRGMLSVRHTGNSNGFSSSVRLLPEKGVGIVVLVNSLWSDAFYSAVEQFAVESVLGLPHAGDSEILPGHTAVRDALRALSAGMSPIDAATSERYVGSYTHGARVFQAVDGLRLQTAFAAVPLMALSDPDTFASGSIATGLYFGQFTESAGIPAIVLGLPREDGIEQILTLERLGE